jgi:hypothetical protein
MNEDINNWKAALAERDARIERLEAELKRLCPPPAAVSYPDGHTTISTVKNRIILPTRDELHRLEEMVYRAPETQGRRGFEQLPGRLPPVDLHPAG